MARGTWVWTQPRPRDLVAFAVAHQVGELFLSMPLPGSGDHADRVAWVREVARESQGWGLRLAALGGDPGWVDEPQTVAGWLDGALSTGAFTGLHLDVEVWDHDGWPTDRLVRDYVRLLETVTSQARVSVEADLSAWLWQQRTADGRPLDAAVLDVVDAATVMSYRTRAAGLDSITGVAAPSLAAAAHARKPLRLAVDTTPQGHGSGRVSFHGRPAADLERALTEVDTHLRDHPTYQGMAVHDQAGWAALRR